MSRTYCILSVVLLFSSLAPSQATLAIRAASAHLGTGEVVTPAVILIEDGKIRAVGKALEIPAGMRTLDWSDLVVMPGMIDPLSTAGLGRGQNENEEGDERTSNHRVLDVLDPQSSAFNSLLRLGVTCVAIQPGIRNVMAGLSAVVKPGVLDGAPTIVATDLALRINLGTDPASGNGSGGGAANLYARRPNSRMGVVYYVREEIVRAQNYAARKAAGKTKPDVELDVILAAMEGKLPVHWLARTEKDIYTALRLIDEFRIPRNVFLEAHEAGEVAEVLKARGIPVLLGPIFDAQARQGRRRGQVDFPLPYIADGESATECVDACGDDHGHDDHDAADKKRRVAPEVLTLRAEREARGIDVPLNPREEALFDGEFDCCAVCGSGAPGTDFPTENEDNPMTSAPRALWKAGAKAGFALGGDRAGETLLDFARFAVRSGLPANRAVPMVTLESARILGIEKRVGSIEPGKDADLVALSASPLSPMADVRIVLIEGRVALDAREHSPEKERNP